MEVLCVHVELNEWLFEEFVHIEVFDSNTSLSCFFNVEPVGAECQVGVNESESLRQVLLNFISWIEDKFQPSLTTLGSDVVLKRSPNLSFVEESAVDESV